MIKSKDETILTGTICHIIYYNKENGYCVFILETKDGDEVTCTGNVLAIEEGLYVTVTGHEIEHPKYGFQIEISCLEEKEPEDILSIEKYLASGAIKGIGPKLAKSIVDKFGEKVLTIIEEEPERLAEIRGISEKKARDIFACIEENRGQRKAMMFLQKYNISNALAVKIYEKYKSDLYAIIKENPYRLSEDIDGVGFKRADSIALAMGVAADSEMRVTYCILDSLKNAAKDGNMFLPKQELLRTVSNLLGFVVSEAEDILLNLSADRKIIIKNLFLNEKDKEATCVVYFAPFYYRELNTAYLLKELNIKSDIKEDIIQQRIKDLEERRNIELDLLQKNGVIEAARNNVFILTGGPGTGKTTTIQAIIDVFEKEGMNITLCAPTGRAARRMTQATGYVAKTIHRLLEVKVGSGSDEYSGIKFEKNDDNPLETDVVIVDEMSMVDINLLYSLLLAIVPGTHVIFIGDTSQLPSVGPGSVLKDMIASNEFASLKLTKIFRQSSYSDIVINAHKIDNGENIDLQNKSEDFFFMSRENAFRVREDIKELVKNRLPAYTKVKPMDIQVLVPMKKGPLGTIELNSVLQGHLNPPSSMKNEYQGKKYIYREGDKVMQIKNNYQLAWEVQGKNDIVIEEGLGVFNGDMGIIEKVDNYYEEITVIFEDDRKVVYPFVGLDELELAYALTIHKSQGSEYPVVIMPILNLPPLLKFRNLLYTGVTRAKTHVVLMGSTETIMEMIKNEKEQKRYSALKTYIQEDSGIL